jgi:tRNA nucleotidyltransferase (CCA-adding enzyme)
LQGLGEPLDIATARTEHYVAPAALPQVEPGSLTDDLRRRDFSINTLAIDLSDGPPFEVLNSYNALEDLEEGRLRVLHDGSFVDDPTRALRGIRFETHVGLRLDARAEDLARSAVADGSFDALSSDRLRREIFRLLEPASAIEANLKRVRELGLLAILRPSLRLSEEDLAWIGGASTALSGLPADKVKIKGWRLVLSGIYGSLDQSAREEVADRLGLRPRDRDWLLRSPRDLDHAAKVLSEPTSTPYEVDRALRPLRYEQIALLLALTDPLVVQWTRRWLEELRPIELSLTGQDLVDSGFAAGPSIGLALEATREARLNGSISAECELQFALNELKSEDPEAGKQ